MESNTIGDWIKTKRVSAGMDLRQLAKLVGANQGHISRIETGKAEISLNYLALLTWAMNTEKIFVDMGLPNLVVKRHQPVLEKISVNKGYVEPQVLVRLVERFANRFPDAIQFLSENLRPAVEKANVSSLPIDDLPGRIRLAVFRGDLLPLPPTLTKEQIMGHYMAASPLTMADAGLFLRLSREEAGLSLEGLAKRSQVNKSTLNRIENNKNSRMLLENMIQIDNALSANGKIFSVFWYAAQLQVGLISFPHPLFDYELRHYDWDEKTSNLIDTFLKTVRWSYAYDDTELRWVDSLKILEVVRAKQGYDISRLAEEIYRLIRPEHLLSESDIKVSKDIFDQYLSYLICEELKAHAKNDVFSMRMLGLYKKYFPLDEFSTVLRILLKELLENDQEFMDKMINFVEQAGSE